MTTEPRTDAELLAVFAAGRVRKPGLSEPERLAEGLRAVFKAGLADGFEAARDNAEVIEHDGWVRCAPFIEWCVAETALKKARGEATCAACRGEGINDRKACARCEGSGVVDAEKGGAP